MLKLYQKDNPDKKLREVQLNPKNTCQFRKLLRGRGYGSRDLHEDARRPRGSSFSLIRRQRSIPSTSCNRAPTASQFTKPRNALM